MYLKVSQGASQFAEDYPGNAPWPRNLAASRNLKAMGQLGIRLFRKTFTVYKYFLIQ